MKKNNLLILGLMFFIFTSNVAAKTFKVFPDRGNPLIALSAPPKPDVSKSTVFIVEVDKNNLATGNGEALNEIEFYNSSGSKIPFTIQSGNEYDSTSGSRSSYWYSGNVWGYINLNNGCKNYGQSCDAFFNYNGSSSSYTGYARFAVTLSSTGLSSASFFVTNNGRMPAEIKLFAFKTGVTLNYNSDVKSRSNTNLIKVCDKTTPAITSTGAIVTLNCTF